MKLRGFLKTAQFYRQFVKDYTNIARQMYDILKDDIFEYWNKKQQTFFNIQYIKKK